MLRDVTAKNIAPNSKPLSDGGVSGLRLHPTKEKGRGLWKLRFISPSTGKRRDMGLGVYPEVAIIEARLQANAARSQVNQGIDPIDARAGAVKESKVENDALTFSEAANKVHADMKVGWQNAKHQAQWINTLKTYAFHIIGDKPVREVEVSDIADVLRPIWLTKAETASRVKQRIHQVMEWSCARGLRVGNPVNGVQHLLPKQPAA